MLSIGELAAQTRASVRMLRHYDALGLVKPVQVDPHTGYRWYAASQVGRVNALMALKALGFHWHSVTTFSAKTCQPFNSWSCCKTGTRSLLNASPAILNAWKKSINGGIH